MNLIKKFNHLLNSNQKKSVIFLLFLIFIGMFLETLGVGLIIPIFSIIMEPDIANKYPSAATFLSALSPLNLFIDKQETVSTQTLLITSAIMLIVFVYFLPKNMIQIR